MPATPVAAVLCLAALAIAPSMAAETAEGSPRNTAWTLPRAAEAIPGGAGGGAQVFLETAPPLAEGPTGQLKPEAPGEEGPSPSSLPPSKRLLAGEDAAKVEVLLKQAQELAKAGKVKDALSASKEVLEIRGRLQGSDHWETVNARWDAAALQRISELPEGERAQYARSRGSIDEAKALMEKGRHGEAQRLFEEALALSRKLLGEEHPDTAACYNNLAEILRVQGKPVEAQPLHEKALAIRRELLGEEHPDTADSYTSLASNLSDRERHLEAQPLFEKALAIQRKLFGEEHFFTAIAYGNLAGSLGAQGKYLDAQPLYEKSSELARKLLGEENGETATSYNNLASNLKALGRLAEAQSLFEKSLALRRKVLGEEHPDTASSYNNLAEVLRVEARYTEAQPLHQRSLALRRKLFGEEHPATALSFANLAEVLRVRGKHAEAQQLCEKALAIRRKLLGEEHTETAMSYNNLASNLTAQGRYAEAQPLLEKALEINRKILGEEHPSTVTCYNNLGMLLDAEERRAEAQTYLEKCLTLRRKLLGEAHPDTFASYNNLAANLNAQGKSTQALPLFDRALAVISGLPAPDLPVIAALQGNLAQCLQDQGRYAEAIEPLERAAEIYEKVRLRISTSGLERAAPERFSVHERLAALHVRLGKPDEAWAHFEASLGRGLFDDISAREARRLGREDRSREADILGLDVFKGRLEEAYGVAAGKPSSLEDIQASLPPDTALIGWLDIPPNRHAIPGDYHRAVIVRAKGDPRWAELPGSGPGGSWTEDDDSLGVRVASLLSDRGRLPDPIPPDLLARLAAQRFAPLEPFLAEGGGLPAVRHVVVLPSAALRGVPAAVIAGRYGASYCPSGTILAWLRGMTPRERRAGGRALLLGDPAFRRPAEAPGKAVPPDHGAYLSAVQKGSKGDGAGLRAGDVLLDYGEGGLAGPGDLAPAIQKADGAGSVPVTVWRDGKTVALRVSPGKLGVRVDRRAAREAVESEREFESLLRAAREGSRVFPPLPRTREEVEAIAERLVASGLEVDRLLGPDASAGKLRELAGGGRLAGYRFLHFATHGVPSLDRIFDSALILSSRAGPGPGEAESAAEEVIDDRITAADIMRDWTLRAELVTLSACETAVGRRLRGEGYVGFAQALLLSGAKMVLLSLWKVDDEATALLMARFYGNVLGSPGGSRRSMGKIEALAEAQGWLRGLDGSEARSELERLRRAGGAGAAEAAEGRPPPALAGEERGDASRQGGVRLKPKREAAEHPYADPYFWAPFILIGDPD